MQQEKSTLFRALIFKDDLETEANRAERDDESDSNGSYKELVFSDLCSGVLGVYDMLRGKVRSGKNYQLITFVCKLSSHGRGKIC